MQQKNETRFKSIEKHHIKRRNTKDHNKMLQFSKALEHTVQNVKDDVSGRTNRIVVGDNLDALTAMIAQKATVDFIYIDPPYNTKKNAFAYNDNRKTEEWVSFLYHRLVLARQVLSEEGAVAISIDDNHYPYLKLLMDEVFDIRNFVGNFIWKKSHTVKNDKKGISTQHEYVLCFAKNVKKLFFNRETTGQDYIRKAYAYQDERGRFRVVPLHKAKNKKHYNITAPDGTVWTKGWNHTPESFENLRKENLIYWGKDGKNCPTKKVYLKEVMDKSYGTILPTTCGYTGDGKKALQNLGFSGTTFLYAKPVQLIKHFLDIFTHTDSLVLDFFAGSGTTAQAVLEKNKEDNGNRVFWLCTNNERNIATDITIPRVEKSLKMCPNARQDIDIVVISDT